LAKRKIRRKELKKPDEFITFSSRIISWCQDNVRIVVGVLASVAVLILITSAVFLFKARRETKARDLYEEALSLYQVESSTNAGAANYSMATAKLEEVKQRYHSTRVAINALMDMGNIYFQEGDYEKAIICYTDFLQRTDASHPLYEQALESLGETYEAKGSWQEAVEVYQRLASEGTPVYQAQAQLYLGRVYEAMGDQQKAMTHYDNYLNDSPALIFGEWIRVKLRRWRQAENPNPDIS
jgi:tetratricopeptide (TPR) repeat protein